MLNNEKQLNRAIQIVSVLIIAGLAVSAFFFYKNRVSLKYKNPPIIDQQIQALEGQINKSPGNFDLRIMIAKRLLERDRISEAVGHLKEANKIKKKNIAANYLLGFAYKEQDDLAEAEKQFKETIKIGEKEQFNKINTYLRDANYYLADIYYADKKYDKAIKYYKAATEIGTADSDTLYKIGQIYMAKKDYKNAMTYFEKALAFVPNYSEVLKDFEEVLKKEPNYAKGHLGLGKAYSMLGKLFSRSNKDKEANENNAKAKIHLNKALKLDPSNKEIKKELASIGKL